jgi:hypothetical protein
MQEVYFNTGSALNPAENPSQRKKDACRVFFLRLLKPWGSAPNPASFLEERSKELIKNRALRGF